MYTVIKEKAFKLCQSGDYQGAIKAYDEILEIFPRNISVLNDKGFALSKLGKYEDALQMHEKVLKIDPNKLSALNNISYVLLRLGRYSESADFCGKVLRMDPNNRGALRRSDFLISKLDKENAKTERKENAEFNAIFQHVPDDEDARYPNDPNDYELLQRSAELSLSEPEDPWSDSNEWELEDFADKHLAELIRDEQNELKIDEQFRFYELVTEMEKLLLTEVPTVKNEITVQEKSDSYDAEAVEKNRVEFDTLKSRYSQICKELLILDNTRANSEIKRIIEMKKQMDANFLQDMKDANQGSWWKGRHLP